MVQVLGGLPPAFADLAAIAAMQFYHDDVEDPGLEALREQEVHRQQAIESLSKWSEHN